MQLMCMRETDEQRKMGARLRLTIEATHGAARGAYAAWCREYGVQPNKLNGWMDGRTWPNIWTMIQYAQNKGLTLDWLYREQIAGVASGVAAVLSAKIKAASEEAPPEAARRAVRNSA